MWIFSVDGFFSAVEHREDHKCVLIRARYKEDLEKFKHKMNLRWKVEATPEADYPYRMTVTKKVWADYVGICALGIDYDNFKDAVLKSASPKRISQYHGVWACMSDNEPLHRRV